MSPFVKEHGAVTMAVQYQSPAVKLPGPAEQSSLFYDPVEYGHHCAVILQQETFRMPLNPQHSTECNGFHTLYYAIGSRSRYAEPGRNLLYSLMVKRVDRQSLLAE